jgi:hypothetical protein
MTMPPGAQLSEDGQWWWDETAQDWRAVDQQGGGGDPAAQPGQPGFDFDQNGVRIDAENGGVPSAGDELKAAFTVYNTGTAGGSAHVVIEVDGAASGVEWDSPWLEPGQGTAPDGDGYVHGIPAQSEGWHRFEAVATPAGHGGGRSGENEISL